MEVRLTAELVYQGAGQEAGRSECHDCGITPLLDGIGWFVIAVLGSAVVVGVGLEAAGPPRCGRMTPCPIP